MDPRRKRRDFFSPDPPDVEARAEDPHKRRGRPASSPRGLLLPVGPVLAGERRRAAAPPRR